MKYHAQWVDAGKVGLPKFEDVDGIWMKPFEVATDAEPEQKTSSISMVFIEGFLNYAGPGLLLVCI